MMSLKTYILIIGLLFCLVPPAFAQDYIVDRDRVNVRSGPSTNYHITHTAYRNQVLQRLNEQSGWLKVRLPNGNHGWIARHLLVEHNRSFSRVDITDDQGQRIGRYDASYALLVWVSDYENDHAWPDLPRIPEEMDALKNALKAQGFHIEEISNPDGKQLKNGIDQFLSNYGNDPNHRLLVFFSGHGYTLNTPTGGKRPYLVPRTAPSPQEIKGFLRHSYDLSVLVTKAGGLFAHHAMFAFDSCFAGDLFASRSIPQAPQHISALTMKPVRQFITAGNAGQTVPAKSIFTPAFITALQTNKAEVNPSDGYVTGLELFNYVNNTVRMYTQGENTPRWANIGTRPGEEGDFVFITGGIQGQRIFSNFNLDNPTPPPAVSPGFLTINTVPAHANVRFLNMDTPYSSGMTLKPDDYHIEVSATGYKTLTRWETVVAGAQQVSITLTKKTEIDELLEVAGQGDANAQFRLGVKYDFGRGVTQDNRQAVNWYRKAAEQGYAAAQNNLGVMYENGEGVTQDHRQAANWYHKAAEQEHARGQYNLGLMYEYGKGVTQDHRQAVNWYRKAAEQGHASAQYNLGLMYKNGEGVTQDDRQAVNWYRKAAEQGHARGQYNLGLMYDFGRGITEDDHQAVKWYQKAAEQGHASAQNNLGVMYENGESVTQDHRQAVNWYRKAAEQGHERGQYNLGLMYKNGEGVDQDHRQAVKWYRKAAEQGHKGAQYNLGLMYKNGEGVTQDHRQAVNWYRKAAEQGHERAQYSLGLMYDFGRSVTLDDQQAAKWYQKAAEQGHASAQYNLGLMNDEGEGIPQDDRQAVKWYRKAAEQGHASAQYNLGLMYDEGEGTPVDDRQAIKWYQKAAEQGHASAQYNLGLMYDAGEGTPVDDRQAVEWYRKAAEQGHASAQYNLGLMYENGEGVNISKSKAISWYKKSAEQGDEDAIKRLRILGTAL